MSPQIKSILEEDKYGRTSWAYFCGEPEVMPIDASHQVSYKDINTEHEHD